MPLVARLNYSNDFNHKREKKVVKLQKIKRRSNILSIYSLIHNEIIKINLDSLQKPLPEKILIAAT